MFETALIDVLAVLLPDCNFALESASEVEVPQIVISTEEDDEFYTSNGEISHHEIQLTIQCFCSNSVNAKSLSQRVKEVFKALPKNIFQYQLIGHKNSNEFGGYNKGDELYYREFTFNATYKES